MQQEKLALPKTLSVLVLRAFTNHERKVLEKGERAVLPRIFALEMKAANKVVIVEDAPPVAATEPAPAPDPAPEKPPVREGRKGDRK